MNNKISSTVELNYSASYGKLFSALINKFGVNLVNEIEDAIQNAFLKSLKIWKNDHIPAQKENWLFIVAQNDVLIHISKKKNRENIELPLAEDDNKDVSDNDLRLETILFISSSNSISNQAKVIFILKNIFGLHVCEIANSTLLSQEAIYKSLKRAKSSLQLEFKDSDFNTIFQDARTTNITVLEEVLYAVFNVGFDSFEEKSQSVVNEDLCLEAISLTKLLLKQYGEDSTSNLLSLFCFHISRIPAKVHKGKLISFFEQRRKDWNKELIDLGFYYLRKPNELNRYYIESLIISKYMLTSNYSTKHWYEIIELYHILISLTNSPYIKLNLCYVLHKANQSQKALEILEEIKNDLPGKYTYFSLVKAKILKEKDSKEAEKILHEVVDNVSQQIRKDYLLEHNFINL